MNDLAAYFPNNQLQSLADDLTSVQTWDDFARRFLLGTGRSPRTYETYLCACRQFYDFTGKLHPMQAGTPEWIEQWYDSLGADLSTKAVKMAALKFMYKRIQARFPFYRSPFDTMSEELKRKLSRTKKDVAERDALTEAEYRGILRMLRKRTDLRGIQDYALVRFAVTSGLRAAELVGLTWENVIESEGTWRATFIGKGSKRGTVQLEAEAVRACRRAFRARWGRKPKGSDLVFHSLATGRGNRPGITKSGLHLRLKRIVAEAQAQGIVRANLNVSTHTLRHTCATRLVSAGVPIDAVQRHLRHSSISTTARYLHNAVDLSTYWATMTGEATTQAEVAA
jgi:integrase